jgi:DNA-binding IclR family transcriptional regulator
LGLAAFEIGSAYLRSEPLERLGRPIIRELSHNIRGVTHLAVLHGANVLYLSREIPATCAPEVAFDVGVRVPAHLTAVGRALLMCRTPRQLDALMPVARSLPGRLGEGLYLRSQLDRELVQAYTRRYATDDGLIVKGVSCIAAPVFSYEGCAMASIGASFHSRDLDSDRRAQVARQVVMAAHDLSDALGCSMVIAAT